MSYSFFEILRTNIKHIKKHSDQNYNLFVVGISAELFSIVSAVTIFALADLYSNSVLKNVMIIWVILSTIKLLFLDKIHNNINRKDSVNLLIVNFVSFLFAQGFWITPTLSLVSNYVFLKKSKS